MSTDSIISSMHFSSEDLFVLLKGFDIALLCCRPSLLERHVGHERKVLDEWRRKLIRKHLSSGLVDDAGTPSPQLERALAPMMTPGIYVADGDSPLEGEADIRRSCVYVGTDAATYAVKTSGLYRGWKLTVLESDNEIRRSVLKLHDLENRIHYNAPADHIVVPNDPEGEWVRFALLNDSRHLDAIAKRVGFDTARLLEIGSWWQKDGLSSQYRARNRDTAPMLEFSTRDLRDCVYEETNGIRSPFPAEGPLVTRMARVFPEMGFSFSIERSPRNQDPDDWWLHDELHEYGQFVTADFIEDEIQLVHILLSVDKNPND